MSTRPSSHIGSVFTTGKRNQRQRLKIQIKESPSVHLMRMHSSMIVEVKVVCLDFFPAKEAAT